MPEVNRSSGDEEQSSAWRPDIQGLRALALLLVVGYHSGLFARSGYVGVDSFFVISGFVIAQMLHREVAGRGTIDIRRFYLRRIKRLYPALLLVVSVSVLLSVVMLPSWTQRTAFVTAGSSLVFGANITIDRLSGNYFATSAELNPFLHIWSLSVEEQFYLVFPWLFLLLSSRKFGQKIRGLLTVGLASLTLLSFAATRFDSMTIAGFNAFGFYSPLSRAWEFGVGVFVASFIRKLPNLSHLFPQVLGLIGLTMLLWSGWNLTAAESSLMGGLWLPTVGTALVLVGGTRGHRHRNVVSQLLSSRPLAWFGDHSYAIYLWHWPILVFAHSNFGTDSWVSAGAIAVAVFLAALSYRLLENPVRRWPESRNPQLLKRVAVFSLAALFASGTGAIGVTRSWWKHESQAQFSAERPALERCTDKPIDLAGCSFGSEFSPSEVFLVGDSTAYTLVEGLDIAAKQVGVRLVVSSRSGCPFSGLDTTNIKPVNCLEWQQAVSDLISERRPVAVIIANLASAYTSRGSGLGQLELDGHPIESDDAAVRVYQESLTKLVEGLSDFGTQIVLVQSLPRPDTVFAPTLFKDWFGLGDPSSFDASRSIDDSAALSSAEKAIASEVQGVSLFDPVTALCPISLSKCSLRVGDESIFADVRHLSTFGSQLLAERWTSLLGDLQNI